MDSEALADRIIDARDDVERWADEVAALRRRRLFSWIAPLVGALLIGLWIAFDSPWGAIWGVPSAVLIAGAAIQAIAWADNNKFDDGCVVKLRKARVALAKLESRSVAAFQPRSTS